MVTKDLGMVTAYAYAVAGGYTGTEEEFTQLMASLADEVSRIENLSVTVTTLPAGSQATASLNGSVLSLGIPKGDKGDKGNTGNTPDLGIGTVTTLSAGSSATASITGTAENPVLNLGIPEGQAGSGAVGTVASAYSSSSTYAVGDYVIHNSNLYRCTTAITTAEAFTAAHWTQVALADDVSDLKSKIILISTIDLSTGEYNENQFYSVSNGVLNTYNGYHSVKIPRPDTNKIRVQNYSNNVYGLANTGVVFWDSGNNYISGVEYDTSLDMTVDIPINASWIGIDMKNVSLGEIIASYKISKIEEIENRLSVVEAEVGGSANPYKYKGKEVAVFNKILCIGDSLTEGGFNYSGGSLADSKYSYPTMLTKMYGVATVNWGLGGYTSPQWLAQKASSDWSGYDCAIIYLGNNDWTIDRDSVENSVNGSNTAIRSIISNLKLNNKGIKIFLCSMLPNWAAANVTAPYINANIKSIANDTSIDNLYLIDLTENSDCKYLTPYVNTHLTAIGYRKMAEEIGSYISYVVANNLEDFKAVQFIGTDYVI